MKLPFFTLLLLISFATVNAVLFTPALPTITNYFEISETTAQSTITWFLVGYTLGQLIYGPIANRFGRKHTLYAGINLQIISSLLCVFAGILHKYELLVLGRFLLAIGAGVGRKITFSFINEYYEPKKASQIVSYLMMAFAITPGLAVMFGGFLANYFGWTSCFYAGAAYGVFLLILVTRLPETEEALNQEGLKVKSLFQGYANQLTNRQLMLGALLMGSTSCFTYVFAALAPFIAINHFGISSAEYGMANIIPPVGIILGSLVCARLVKVYAFTSMMRVGILIATIAAISMYLLLVNHVSIYISLFFSATIINFGLCFVFANSSTIAMSHASNKAYGSAVMNFMSLGLVTMVVLSLGLFSVKPLLLPAMFFLLCIVMMILFKLLTSSHS